MEQKKKNVKTFGQHLDDRYGKTGTQRRTDFEIKTKSFAIGELIKEERRLAQLTQEQLAEKIGAKKVSSRELRMGIMISNFQPYINSSS